MIFGLRIPNFTTLHYSWEKSSLCSSSAAPSSIPALHQRFHGMNSSLQRNWEQPQRLRQAEGKACGEPRSFHSSALTSTPGQAAPGHRQQFLLCPSCWINNPHFAGKDFYSFLDLCENPLPVNSPPALAPLSFPQSLKNFPSFSVLSKLLEPHPTTGSLSLPLCSSCALRAHTVLCPD